MSTLRSATIRLAYQVPALRPHLMSVLAASVADEVASVFWEGVSEGAYDEAVSDVSTEETDLEWVDGEGTSPFEMPYAIQYEVRGTLGVDIPVSPAAVERILERAIREDGPKKFVAALDDAVRDSLPDGVEPDRAGTLFHISKCEPRVVVHEVAGGFRFEAAVGVSIEVTGVEVEPPEQDYSDPREGDVDDGDGDWQRAQNSWERERGY